MAFLDTTGLERLWLHINSKLGKVGNATSFIKEASGEVIAVNDSAEQQLLGLKLYGKTTQDGTPMPNAPVPLVNVGASGSIGVKACGKNLFNDKNFAANILITETGEEYVSDVGARITEYIPVLPNTTYHISATSSHRGKFYGKNKEVLTSVLDFNAALGGYFTTTGNTYFVRFNYYHTAVAPIQLELGSVATDYEPYTATTLTAQTPNGLPGIPVTSGGNYTDAND